MSLQDYETVIGLETHVQLRTRTKIFCSCANVYGAPPNSAVCPVCLGLPGALPVANREAFELAIRAGLGLGCEIAEITRFDRKNYFYPDLPKGYQVSQLAHPINGPGRLRLSSGAAVGINRAHLEEDAGKSQHDPAGTLVDLNRCGIPLLEIVTEPEIDSPEMAYDYLVELKLLLRHLGISDCDMEKGSLRCDVNVSLRRRGATALATKVELKNLNSFKMVRRALEYEQRRQSALYDAGETIDVEETRLWDDDQGETRLMRRKEGSADYRYFPDPDIPPFRIPNTWIDAVRASLPELPAKRVERWVATLGLSEYDAGVLVQDPAVAAFFEDTADGCGDAKLAANWVGGELFGILKERGVEIDALALTASRLSEIIVMSRDGTLSVQAARQVLQAIVESNEDPRGKAEEMGLIQLNDEAALRGLVRAAMAANPKAVAELRGGKKKAGGAIVGYVMRESQGRANPQEVNRLLDEELGTD